MTKSSKGTVENPGKKVAQKSGLSRSILRQGWYDFSQKLEWQAKKHGSYIFYCPPQYTSITCNNCGNKDKENRKMQDKFECTSCGHAENADTNAAKNIRDKASGQGVYSLKAPSIR